MEDWDKICAVQRMQEYIQEHIDDEITLQALSEVSKYSLWHSLRIFKELIGKTPLEFARAVKLTKAAEILRDTNDNILEVAFDLGFESHDGFTRAFSKQFDMTPQKYRKDTPPIHYFTYTPIEFYYRYVKTRRENIMEPRKVSGTVTVSVIERPARKLILLRSKKATDYFSFCEEMCCEWHGLLNSIPEKFDVPALLTLPLGLMKEGTSSTAAGVEVPADYAKSIPNGYEIIDLKPCKMMYFQGMPFENEEDYGEAIGTIFEAIANYNPMPYGYIFDDGIAPKFNFGASAELGAKMAVPISCTK